MIITRPLKNDADLLTGHERKNLTVCDLSNNIVKTIHPPASGWTHTLLENINYNKIAPTGWNAFLAWPELWIGSSEI